MYNSKECFTCVGLSGNFLQEWKHSHAHAITPILHKSDPLEKPLIITIHTDISNTTNLQIKYVTWLGDPEGFKMCSFRYYGHVLYYLAVSSEIVKLKFSI